MDLVGKPNTKLPIWNNFHSCHPSVFVQVSSSVFKRPAGQVCIGEAFSKLARYERDSGKWKMLKKCGNIRRNSYSACLVEEQWTVSKPDAPSQHNRLSLSTGYFNFVSVCHK